MKATLTAEQSAFFTKNGFIEFEIAHDLPPFRPERDLWRSEPSLKQLLVRKLGPLALILSGKKQLCLACDQWISKENRPRKGAPLKELFSIQGLAIAIALAQNTAAPLRKSPLGILPVPSASGNILFFRPELILDWPHVETDLYFAIYALPSAVYIYNPKDPATHFLKQLGYQFGDPLRSEFHPLIL